MRSVVLVAVVALASCGGDVGSQGAGSTAPSTSLDPALSVDGPVLRYPEAVSGAEELNAPAEGSLQLEGSCLYLVATSTGERYPLVWPAGTTWDGATESVVSLAGERMPIGGAVSGGGGYFSVGDVGRIAGPIAAALAEECVENSGEIAIVNNSGTAIGPAEN